MIQRPIAYIAGLGVAIPERVVTNADFEKTLDTSDQWIVERTGIRERRFARPDETVSTMGKDAAVKALCRAGTTASELDCIIVATATPDSPLPSTACQIQALLGAERAATFDIAAACSGFVYGLTIAEGLIATGQGERILVIGGEKLTSITDSHGSLNRDPVRRRRGRRGGAGAPPAAIAASSRPSSAPTAGSNCCSTFPAAARLTRSARRWCGNGPTT